jgi:hypothetical protein
MEEHHLNSGGVQKQKNCGGVRQKLRVNFSKFEKPTVL